MTPTPNKCQEGDLAGGKSDKRSLLRRYANIQAVPRRLVRHLLLYKHMGRISPPPNNWSLSASTGHIRTPRSVRCLTTPDIEKGGADYGSLSASTGDITPHITTPTHKPCETSRTPRVGGGLLPGDTIYGCMSSPYTARQDPGFQEIVIADVSTATNSVTVDWEFDAFGLNPFQGEQRIIEPSACSASS